MTAYFDPDAPGLLETLVKLTNLTSLKLGENGVLGPPGALVTVGQRFTLSVLPQLTSLITLDLNNCNLNGRGCHFLAPGLTLLVGLKELDLGGNPIYARSGLGLWYLLPAITFLANNNLRQLNLQGCILEQVWHPRRSEDQPGTGLMALVVMLEQHPNLIFKYTIHTRGCIYFERVRGEINMLHTSGFL